MKTPSKLIIILMLIISTKAIKSNAQTFKNFDKKLERKIENAIERKVNRHIDKTINSIDKETDKEINNVKKGTKNTKEEKTNDSKKSNSLEEIDEEGENEINFKQGNRIIFSDNFEKDATGDFPAKWNSTQGGEVKKLKGFNDKFLKIPAKSVVNIELTKSLPVNFTAEVDVIIPGDIDIRMASIGFGKKPFIIDYLLAPSNKDGIAFSFHKRESGHGDGLKYGRQGVNTNDGFETIKYDVALNKIIKVAFAVNGKRIRMFVDGKKQIDMPSGFDATFGKAFFFCASTHGAAESKLNYFYISNVVIAEAGNDERSQVLKDLMEKGSFSTNAILFATGSDVIENSSNDIISQIAAAMNEAPELKLKIVGHTDNVGDKNKNLVLSSKRANAVKMALVKKGINPSRLVTEGKGDEEPISNNNSDEGKAQNRRVEFIKLN